MRGEQLLRRRARCLARGRLVAEFLAEAWRRELPASALPADLDLAAIEPFLLASGAGALGWWRLRGAASAIGEHLRAAYRFHAMQWIRHDGDVALAFRVVQDSGAEPLLGKGWAAARLYPEPGLRPYGDVDLYVSETRYEAARAAVDGPANTAGAFIDLHRGFRQLDDRPVEELYRRSAWARAGGGEVRVLGPEDHLRLLCLHLLGHGACRPLWLCDVAAAVASRGAGFDWEYLMIGSPLRTEAVGCALTLAAELLRARLDGVPPTLAPRRLPAWVVRSVLMCWGDPRFIPHGQRDPMADLRGLGRISKGLAQRWPNPIEATMAHGARFDDRPRLPLQLAECAARIARFARSRSHGGSALEPSQAGA